VCVLSHSLSVLGYSYPSPSGVGVALELGVGLGLGVGVVQVSPSTSSSTLRRYYLYFVLYTRIDNFWVALTTSSSHWEHAGGIYKAPVIIFYN